MPFEHCVIMFLNTWPPVLLITQGLSLALILEMRLICNGVIFKHLEGTHL